MVVLITAAELSWSTGSSSGTWELAGNADAQAARASTQKLGGGAQTSGFHSAPSNANSPAL